ncbi:TRAP transporter small permease subunit [Dechloromonas sp. XY25]|uniref:TRAP transporter small permease protein n=1 Tax=Dechloromonas hankyongensis TaxID=2908002 RepID=A0ABS9JX11_9RHOO|nr:TRAP transporter small permease subunit [Dechloromonas hankyongensis]MCG2575438.1 TRAP transporter small permease subunit [Dechloromonas hankyongensis]
MKPLLKLSTFIDGLNLQFGKLADWLVLLPCLISAGNAMVRYAFDYSSNGWLKVQWYMFAGIVLLGASYPLKLNEHVRVDVLYGRLSPKLRAWIDLLGFVFFLLPACFLLMKMSWSFFELSYHTNEVSSNAGGLTRWWVKFVLPLGFGLLTLQGLSELIKRIGYLTGQYNMDTHYERPLQ